jgi:hypothetical protein
MEIFKWYEQFFCKNCRENMERMDLGYNPHDIPCLTPIKCKILETISFIIALPILILIFIILIPILFFAIIANFIDEKKVNGE